MTTFQASGGINTNTLEPSDVSTLVNAYTTHTAKMQIGSSSNTGSATNVGICVAPLVTSTSRTISIGKTTVDSVHVANVEHIGPAISNASAPLAGLFEICTAQTTGILNIGTGVRTTTGAINIGTNATTSATIIGNNTTTANTLSLRSGSAGITLASNNIDGINVKGRNIDVVSAGTLSLGTTTATNVGIGTSATGTTTINNALTATGLITANGGLTMGGSNNITLGSGAVAPTSAQLGYLFSGTTTIPGLASGAATVLNQVALPVGTWLICYNVITTTTATTTMSQYAIGVGDTSAVFNTDGFKIGGNINSSSQLFNGVYTNPIWAGSGVVQITTATTYYLNFLSVWSGGTLSLLSNTLYAIRLA